MRPSIIGSVSAVLEAIAESENDKSASVKDVIEAIEEVHELYEDLCRVTTNLQDDNWNQVGAAERSRRSDFGRWQEMTALDACFSAGRLIVDEYAMHLPRRENSSWEDLARFATRVNESLGDVSLRTIEEQLRKEGAVVSGSQPNYADEWEELDNNQRNVVLAVLRLHDKIRHQKTFKMDRIKIEAMASGPNSPMYVGDSTLPKISRDLQLTGFLVAERRQFLVPKAARDWLRNFEAEVDAGHEPKMKRE